MCARTGCLQVACVHARVCLCARVPRSGEPAPTPDRGPSAARGARAWGSCTQPGPGHPDGSAPPREVQATPSQASLSLVPADTNRHRGEGTQLPLLHAELCPWAPGTWLPCPCPQGCPGPPTSLCPAVSSASDLREPQTCVKVPSTAASAVQARGASEPQRRAPHQAVRGPVVPLRAVCNLPPPGSAAASVPSRGHRVAFAAVSSCAWGQTWL